MAVQEATRRLAHDQDRALASRQLGANLQAVLVDLVELHLQAKQAHWNVVGPDFVSVHELLDAVVDTARDRADLFAERMRALQAVPDGRTDTVARTTTLPPISAGEAGTRDHALAIAGRIATCVRTMRGVHDAVDAEDPATADLLHGAIDDLEKHAWMLTATAR
jgi:starvation-inducible DNA-binding protein